MFFFIDIDECALGIHECEPREECENDEGTYFCFITELDGEEEGGKCPVGHKFNAENSVCDGKLWTPNIFLRK